MRRQQRLGLLVEHIMRQVRKVRLLRCKLCDAFQRLIKRKMRGDL